MDNWDGLWLLLAFTLGWMVAQGIKLIWGIIKDGGVESWGRLVYHLTRSGGMPSGHTASFVGLDTALFFDGGLSATLVVALCMTAIIIYDAVNVRYAVGEQGKILNEMVEHHGHERHGERQLKLVEGHTIWQVAVGSILGAGIGVAVALLAGWIC